MCRPYRQTKRGQAVSHKIMHSLKASQIFHGIPPSPSRLYHATGLPHSPYLTYVLLQKLHRRDHPQAITCSSYLIRRSEYKIAMQNHPPGTNGKGSDPNYYTSPGTFKPNYRLQVTPTQTPYLPLKTKPSYLPLPWIRKNDLIYHPPPDKPRKYTMNMNVANN